MTGLLERQRLPLKRGWVRWLASAGLSLVLAGGAWRAVRPWMTLTLARSSVGCPGRPELIAAALRDLYPDRGPQHVGELTSKRQPGSSVVRWLTPRGTWAFADGDLRYLGAARMDYFWSVDSADADRDGCLEIVSQCSLSPPGGNPNMALVRWVVLRLHASQNEVLGVVTGDRTSSVFRRFVAVRPIWRDEDGNGLAELVFLGFTRGRLPNGSVGLLPPEVFAVFEWNAPGGGLRPRQLPLDGSLVVWEPPDGQPVRASPEERLQPLLDALVSLPEEFGLPAAPSPASAPGPQEPPPTAISGGPTSTRSSWP